VDILMIITPPGRPEMGRSETVAAYSGADASRFYPAPASGGARQVSQTPQHTLRRFSFMTFYGNESARATSQAGREASA
jgi:hypothetical protein